MRWLDLLPVLGLKQGKDELQIDIVFGEIMNHETSGILLIEKEGTNYKETHWGQPKWSLFLTEPPTEDEFDELVILRKQMEDKLLGSFSIRENASLESGNSKRSISLKFEPYQNKMFAV
jgi:hypothetical protein